MPVDNQPARSPSDEKSEPKPAPPEEPEAPADWELLPADPNYSGGLRLYRYRGTVRAGHHLAAGCVQHWQQFRGRPTGVIVASFPKSGTNWLMELVWRKVHREAGAESGGGLPLGHRFPLLDAPLKDKVKSDWLHHREDPRLIQTHLHHHLLPASVLTSGAKMLYISRDPCDVCVSCYHFSRMINFHMYRGTFTEFRDSFMRGELVCGPYREHVKGYLDHSETVLCVTYEQLHQDRASVVRRVATFLDRPLTEVEVIGIVHPTSFEAMKANPGTNFRHWENNGMTTEGHENAFMRKGKTGDWRNYFTEDESDAFMKWVNDLV